MRINDYIELFNSDGFDGTIVNVFNNVKNFFRVVAKKEKQAEIDLSLLDYSNITKNDNFFLFLDENGFLHNVSYFDFDDSLKNYFLEHLISKDSTTGLKYICDNLLTDVDVRSDGYWLTLRDSLELSDFFETSGRYDVNSKELAKEIFSEDGLDFTRYWDTTTDVYSDVIEVLDESNTQNLANYILKMIGYQDLIFEEYSSEFFEELVEIQARGEFFQITSENVYDLIEDSEAMKELLKADLVDLNSELYSIHSDAYNLAYEEEIYQSTYNGLDDFFSSKIEEERVQSGDKTKYVKSIKIRDFQDNVMVFIETNKGYDYSDSVLEYWGGYTTMMVELIKQDAISGIDINVPDWADWQLTEKYINELFTDYI